ncbi:MAG: CvpA family protein [Verrucomicrobiota bacterium]
MNLDEISGNWFDVVVVLVMLAGLWRGYKRGLSEEMLGILPWLAGVMMGGKYYGVMADLLAPATRQRAVYNSILGYLIILILILLGFALIKKVVGQKPVSSELFGRSEHLLGMLSGLTRYLCIVVAVLAILNAIVYSPQEIAAQRVDENAPSGSPALPGFAVVHYQIMQESAIVLFMQQHLSTLLITPVTTAEAPKRDNLRKRVEKELNRVIENK